MKAPTTLFGAFYYLACSRTWLSLLGNFGISNHGVSPELQHQGTNHTHQGSLGATAQVTGSLGQCSLIV